MNNPKIYSFFNLIFQTVLKNRMEIKFWEVLLVVPVFQCPLTFSDQLLRYSASSEEAFQSVDVAIQPRVVNWTTFKHTEILDNSKINLYCNLMLKTVLKNRIKVFSEALFWTILWIWQFAVYKIQSLLNLLCS